MLNYGICLAAVIEVSPSAIAYFHRMLPVRFHACFPFSEIYRDLHIVALYKRD